MWKSLQASGWRSIWPRILADFVVVHLSMLAALAISVVYQTAAGNSMVAAALTIDFAKYYLPCFCPLSFLFPLIFLLNGFYTHTRGYGGDYKTLVILRGVVIAAAIFFTANTLLFRDIRVGRSMAVPFVILAGGGVVLSRILKQLIADHGHSSAGAAEKNADRGPVLVIGGAGYIGSLLVERLLEEGMSVRVWDSLVYGDESLRGVERHPRFELLKGDCRHIQDVVKAMRGVDSVIHLGAIVGDPACEQDRSSALEINFAATKMLIEFAKGNGVRRFIFASSCSVYGEADLETDENSAVNPISLYAQTKVDSERALLEGATSLFRPTILRFATVFGLGNRPRFDLVVNLLTAKAHHKGVITVFNGQQWRPFVHVRDLVTAISLTLRAPLELVGGEVFNVGDSRMNHTLEDVAETIRRVFPNTIIENVENADKRNYRVNFTKVRNRLGFQCRYSLQDGIEELKRALDAGVIGDYMDPRHNNQRYLKQLGTLASKHDMDTRVMAAFAGGSMTERIVVNPVSLPGNSGM